MHGHLAARPMKKEQLLHVLFIVLTLVVFWTIVLVVIYQNPTVFSGYGIPGE